MTAIRRQTVFAGLDQPGAWPPTPRALRPTRLELAIDSLPGVAVATQRKLGKLGLATVRDVLEHRPRPCAASSTQPCLSRATFPTRSPPSCASARAWR